MANGIAHEALGAERTGADSSAAILSTGRLSRSMLVDHHQKGTPSKKNSGKDSRIKTLRRREGLTILVGSKGVWIPPVVRGDFGSAGVAGLAVVATSATAILPDSGGTAEEDMMCPRGV